MFDRRLRAAGFLALALILAPCPAAAQTAKSDQRAEIAAGLKTVPVYVVIEELYPEIFDTMVSKVSSSYLKGQTTRNIALEVRPLFLDLLTKQLPYADTANTLAMARLTIEQATAAAAIDAKACMVLLGASTEGPLPGEILPRALLERELGIMAEILRQTARSPSPAAAPMDDGKLEKLAIQAYDAMPSDQLRVAFQEFGGDPTKADDDLERLAFCEFSIALYRTILKDPPVEAALTIKALNATK